MRLPSYITEKTKKKIANLLRQCKPNEKELLKKIILVASYGTMVQGKIEFEDVISQLNAKILTSITIENWWDFKNRANTPTEKFFGIPYELIYKENINKVEIEIVKLMYGEIEKTKFSKSLIITREYIKPKFNECFKQMFNKI